jgi:hypothetical protein
VPIDTAVQNSPGSLLHRRPAFLRLAIKLDTAVIRGSFSNVPVWQVWANPWRAHAARADEPRRPCVLDTPQ